MAIPPEFTENRGIEPGDQLDVVYNDILIIRPPKLEKVDGDLEGILGEVEEVNRGVE